MYLLTWVLNSKWFEPSSISHLCCVMVRERIVLKGTEVGDLTQLTLKMTSTHIDDHTRQTIYWVFHSLF